MIEKCKICGQEIKDEDEDGVIDQKGNLLCWNCNDNYVWCYQLNKYIEDD